MTLVLTTTQRQILTTQAKYEAPAECCGILVGRQIGTQRFVDSVVPGSNVAREDRHRRYVIDPEVLLATHRLAREKGLEVVGYYHSHPQDPAEPSQQDQRHAWPSVSYVIVGHRRLGDGDEPEIEIRSWRLAGSVPRMASGPFVEEQVIVDEDGEKLPES